MNAGTNGIWRLRVPRGVVLAAAALAAGVHAQAMQARAGTAALALTDDNRLLRFDVDAPGTVQQSLAVTGLADGEDLLGIDFRPSVPGQLYGLGSTGRLYRLNRASGQASPVGGGLFAPAGLQGEFGFDINPVTDEARVVSDEGRNRRVDPETGDLISADGDLFYPAGDEGEGEGGGEVPFVSTTAYTNSFAGADETLKYGIDGGSNALVLLDPPTTGQLATVGALGAPGVEGEPLFVGFDIFGADNRALAASTALFSGTDVVEHATLFDVDLATGAATAVGRIGDGSLTIQGLAVGPDGVAAVPLPSALLMFPAAAALAAAYQCRLRRLANSQG